VKLATGGSCAGIAPEAHEEACAYNAWYTVATLFKGAQINILPIVNEVMQRCFIPLSLGKELLAAQLELCNQKLSYPLVRDILLF